MDFTMSMEINRTSIDSYKSVSTFYDTIPTGSKEKKSSRVLTKQSRNSRYIGSNQAVEIEKGSSSIHIRIGKFVRYALEHSSFTSVSIDRICLEKIEGDQGKVLKKNRNAFQTKSILAGPSAMDMDKGVTAYGTKKGTIKVVVDGGNTVKLKNKKGMPIDLISINEKYISTVFFHEKKKVTYLHVWTLNEKMTEITKLSRKTLPYKRNEVTALRIKQNKKSYTLAYGTNQGKICFLSDSKKNKFNDLTLDGSSITCFLFAKKGVFIGTNEGCHQYNESGNKMISSSPVTALDVEKDHLFIGTDRKVEIYQQNGEKNFDYMGSELYDFTPSVVKAKKVGEYNILVAGDKSQINLSRY